MPLEKCIDCGATMTTERFDYTRTMRSMCPRCLYYEDYHQDQADVWWCTDAGYLDKKKDKVRHCTRCRTPFYDHPNIQVKISGESIFAERHALCRTCFDVIKYWLSSNSRKYQPTQ